MLRGYRRRFVAINMALIALVLALALGMQLVHIYRSEYKDLRKTMGLILEPWRGADGDFFRPQEIIPKGERPDPSTYLDKKYIRKHLKRFRKGISLVMGQDSYVMYVIARKHVGREDNSCFVMPKSVCDDIAKAANGNLAVYEEALGFPPGYFYGHGGLVRMDVVEVEDLHLRLPSGNEAGANSYWLPGGYTSGGVPEAVTDLIPKSRLMVTLLPSPQDGSCP